MHLLAKKGPISLLFLAAYFLLAAHSFIPHHHHDESTVMNHHHHHADNGDSEKNDKADHHSVPFTDLTHNADFGKVIVKLHFEKQFLEKPIFEGGRLLCLYNKLASFESPPQPHPPDDDSPLHLIFLSHSLPLRAPPASSCLS